MEIYYWHALNSLPSFGPVTFKKILRKKENISNLWKATNNDLDSIGITRKQKHDFFELKKKNNYKKEFDKLNKNQVKAIAINDKKYPVLLKQIYDPPPILYYKGSITELNRKTLAIVGTRKSTPYGKYSLEKIMNNISLYSISTISGLAEGIDTIAHQASLSAGIPTFAVIASGLDEHLLFPQSNSKLASKIINNNGAIISEFPLGVAPLKHHFPMRNRIISGLSLATFVIEAPTRSGALITAYNSLEQNRDVFAIPGNINQNNSTGTNNLIKEGAKLISSAKDIIEELGLTSKKIKATKKYKLNPEEDKIIALIRQQSLHVDIISRKLNINISEINQILINLEITGIIKNDNQIISLN